MKITNRPSRAAYTETEKSIEENNIFTKRTSVTQFTSATATSDTFSLI
jgi:hypothetical protein